MSTAEAYLAEEIDQTTAGDTHSPRPATVREAKAVAAPQPAQSDVQCLCPFCGTFNSGVGRVCTKCNVADTSETRAATKQRLGPWHVLQGSNPMAPGMSFEELKSLVRQNVVTSRSVVRGPSTAHLWRLASRVRGLSREFGLCYACGGDIETSEISCPHCDRTQTVPEATSVQAPQSIKPPVGVGIPESAPVAPRAPEPTIHVHTLSDPGDAADLAVRPVIAEQSERHIPKDDLLTPRDVAKAFQLEFGSPMQQIDRYFDRYSSGRRTKIFVTSAAALVVALALVWPLIHAVTNGSSASPPVIDNSTAPLQVASIQAPATPVAEARVASYEPRESNAATGATQQTHMVPCTDPIIVADPTPTASSEDDPATLWNTGIDAESTGNYARAVEAYERIQSLPSYAWPAHLQVRLELARRELKGEMH